MWQRSILEAVRMAKERGLCLYGAGFWGRVAYDVFNKLGLEATCFCDDDIQKQNSQCCGRDVLSLEDACAKYPKAVYIPCIDVTKKVGTWNRLPYHHMLQRLKECNVYDSNSELRILMYVFLLDLDEEKQKGYKMPDDCIKIDYIKNLLILNHMSNSGSYYMEQLLDGHPEILSLPYSGQTFWSVYKERLQYLEGQELLYEMMAQMLGYLHSKYEYLFCVREHHFEEYCVDKNGEFISDVLVDPNQFYQYLKNQFSEDQEIRLKSYSHMLKIYVTAYNNCLNKKGISQNLWLFYHMHMPEFDLSKTADFFGTEEFERIENLIIIREPVQQCYSWIKRMVLVQKRNTFLKKGELFTDILKCEMGMTLQKKSEVLKVKVIRFEDLKFDSQNTLKALCEWLNISYLDILLSTTLNGITIYFPTYTKDGVKYITGNDMSAVAKKDFSEIFTLWDEARLNMIYAKFKHAYGYECSTPDFDSFSEETRTELLSENFKFCDLVQQVLDEYGLSQDHYDVNEYVKNLYKTYMDNYQENIEYYDYIKPKAGE